MMVAVQVEQKGETMVVEKAERLVDGMVGSMGESLVVKLDVLTAVSMDMHEVGSKEWKMAAWMVDWMAVWKGSEMVSR